MNSIYKQIAPQSEDIKPLIKLYYIHQSTAKNAIEKITYFPNYGTTINVYENSKVSWSPFSRTHKQERNDSYLKLLVGKFDRSREIILNGPYNKLTIVFNPLGLNNFIDIPLANIIESHFSFFDYFGDTFDQTLQQVFSSDNLETKRDILDKFFESKLIGFVEHRLSFAINQILKTGGDISILALADELLISRRTLHRIFKAHLGFSPMEYKSIVKFRRALNIYQNRVTKTNFSSLSYAANFYDQSDLNAHFKVKTGLSPKQLFSVIETIERELYWKVEYVPKVQDI